MSLPLPIVVCALDDQIGKPVSELLLPEFEGQPSIPIHPANETLCYFLHSSVP